MSLRKRIAGVAVGAAMALSVPTAAMADHSPLVDVTIGDITILEDVNLAVGATVVGNICVGDVNVAAVIAAVEDFGDFECTQRGTGNTVVIAEN